MSKTIYAGTTKGLFVLKSDSRDPLRSVKSISFEGRTVFAVGRSGDRIWASPYSEWTGAELYFSDDGGKNWSPSTSRLSFPKNSGAALSKVWQITSGGGTDDLYIGAEPSALFLSNDGGSTFELCEGLWNHPHREKWTPGNGGLCLHSIVPLDEQTWVVGMSTGGVYRTTDKGLTWKASNQEIVTPFLPERIPEFGQCVHKIAYDSSKPDELFLQHHWGVYRSRDRGQTWVDVGKDKELPSDFGFPCVSSRGSVFIIPLTSDEFRVFPEGRLRVFRTDDGGETWSGLEKGLPQENVYDAVLRDSFSSCAVGGELAFGTTGGTVFFSDDNGDSWNKIAEYLPRITSLTIY